MQSSSPKSKTCNTCKLSVPASVRCSNCKQVYYCNKECQAKDWKGGHSDLCLAWPPELVSRVSAMEDYVAQSNPHAHVLLPECGEYVSEWVRGLKEPGDHRSWGCDKASEFVPFLVLMEYPTVFGPVISIGFYSNTLNEWDMQVRLIKRDGLWYIASTMKVAWNDACGLRRAPLNQQENEPEYSFLVLRDRKLISLCQDVPSSLASSSPLNWTKDQERMRRVFEHNEGGDYSKMCVAGSTLPFSFSSTMASIYIEKTKLANNMVIRFEIIRPKVEAQMGVPEVIGTSFSASLSASSYFLGGYVTDVMPKGTPLGSGLNIPTHLPFRLDKY